MLSEKTLAASDEPQRILKASTRCLRLLVEGMTFAFSTATPSDEFIHPVPSRAEEWQQLMSQLQQWQKTRPPSLEPLIDVENTENVFPTVLFTSGAGTSINIVYHTAMVLLLSNKPPSVSFDEQVRGSEMDPSQTSPDWHAFRVCGIAMNSEPGCWDPVLIAAFSLVAQREACRPQMDAIITSLSRLKASGWRIDSLINKLCA